MTSSAAPAIVPARSAASSAGVSTSFGVRDRLEVGGERVASAGDALHRGAATGGLGFVEMLERVLASGALGHAATMSPARQDATARLEQPPREGRHRGSDEK